MQGMWWLCGRVEEGKQLLFTDIRVNPGDSFMQFRHIVTAWNAAGVHQVSTDIIHCRASLFSQLRSKP